MKLRQITFSAGIIGLILSSATSAQEVTQNPSFGSTSLDAGFRPDPYTVNLRSGGNIDAKDLGGDCAGWIADAPDYRLIYKAGALPLIITVESDVDTTLIINTPNGNWLCDDDGGGDLDPRVKLSKPQSGQYDIWVGTYNNSSVEPAILKFSEVE